MTVASIIMFFTPEGAPPASRRREKSTPAQVFAGFIFTRGRGQKKMTIPPRTHKRCTRCQGWLALEAFRVNRRADPWGHSVGRDSWCRSCHAEATREWREANPDRIEAYNERRRQAYRQANPLPERTCVVCGRPFAKRPDALVCSPRCREERKNAQRRTTAAVASVSVIPYVENPPWAAAPPLWPKSRSFMTTRLPREFPIQPRRLPRRLGRLSE